MAVGPINFGSTRTSGIWLLVALLGAAGLSWAAELTLARRLPVTPLPVLLGLGALAFAALLWLSGAPEPTAPADFTRTHFARVVDRWPHSVVGFEMGATVALHAGLGLALWIVTDLARDRAWLVFFSSVMVGTGVVIALLAFLQNQTHATGIFWQPGDRMPGRFWGTFFHHTSAGAYLNTLWPLAAGLALTLRGTAATSRTIQFGAIAAGLALIILLGAHATHISRLPQAVALMALPLLFWRLLRGRSRSLRSVAWAVTIPLGLLAIVLAAGRTGEIAQRWRLLDFSTPKNVRTLPPEAQWPRLVRADLLIPNFYNGRAFGDRGEAQRTALRAIAARPLTGHGPGNWHSAASQHSSDPYVRSFYLYLQFAHADFLQAWTEWGAAGLISALLLLPGAVIAGWWSAAPADPLSAALVLCAAIGLSLVLIQSLLDFPLQIPAVALNASVLAGLCWSSRPSSQYFRRPALSAS